MEFSTLQKVLGADDAAGDLLNGLQVFPNLIGLIGPSGLVAVAARAKITGR